MRWYRADYDYVSVGLENERTKWLEVSSRHFFEGVLGWSVLIIIIKSRKQTKITCDLAPHPWFGFDAPEYTFCMCRNRACESHRCGSTPSSTWRHRRRTDPGRTRPSISPRSCVVFLVSRYNSCFSTLDLLVWTHVESQNWSVITWLPRVHSTSR